MIWQINSAAVSLKKDVPVSIGSLSLASELDSLAYFIRYYDEILTQSARNYAFTEDGKWKDRYLENVKVLDEKIKTAIEKGDQTDKEIFRKIDSANLALVEMEENAMAAVDSGEADRAIRILESEEYWNQKKIYQDGLIKYSENRGSRYDETLSNVVGVLKADTEKVQAEMDDIFVFFLGAVAVGLIFDFFAGWFFSGLISRPIRRLIEASREMAAGHFDKRVDIPSKDEFGDLAKSFNTMATQVEKAHREIEKKVEERTADLEKTNKYLVDRELKMIELKKQISLKKKNENKK